MPEFVLRELISRLIGSGAQPRVLAFLAEDGAGSGGFFGGGQGTIFLLFVVLATFFLVMRIATRRTTRTERVSPRERRATAREDKPNVHGSAHPELEKLYVDLHDFSREIEARIDTKIAYLKGLIEEAERVGAQIEDSIETGKRLSPSSPLGSREVPTTPETASEEPASEDATEDALEEGKQDAEPAATMPEDLDPESVLEGEEKAQLRGEAPLDVDTSEDKTDASPELGKNIDVRVGSDSAGSDQVIELYRKGQSVGDIATQLGLPRGEVELMINLAESSNAESSNERA